MQQYQLVRLLVFVFGLAATSSYGQNSTWDLQQISLRDTFLVQEIEKLIVSMEQSDENFGKGLGYIKVSEELVAPDSISRKYFVRPSLMTIGVGDSKPQYYTWIKDRPVFIYLQSFDDLTLSQISKKSQKKLSRILNKYLLPPIKGKARDEDGNVAFMVKDLREEYFFSGDSQSFIIRYDIHGVPSVDFNTHYPIQVDNGL